MTRIALYLVLTALLLASCNSRQSTPMVGVTHEQLPFPIGEKIESSAFTGDAFINPMIVSDTVFHFPQTNSLTFSPGAHSNWHRHGGMVVLVTGGVGLYQEEGKAAQILRTGDVLEIPAGVRHWHGATKDNWFSQIVIYDAAWQSDISYSDEDDSVSDMYYNELNTTEFPHPFKTEDVMFAVPDSMQIFDTFSGPIRVSDILGDVNVANAASLHYVVFEPGVINAWHTHPDGQILIVTEGIGYHQMEGLPVEVLYPGDVAICPKGVRHWHGASLNSRFAHLSVNTDPNVEWYEMISNEDYNKLPKE